MKKLLFLINILILPLLNFSQTIYFAGNITSNTTWSADTVEITGDVNVINATLTINPGTYVEFQGDFSLNFSNSKLIAIGTPKNLITFNLKKIPGFYDPLAIWGLIEFDGPPISDSSIISYCNIYSSSGISISNYSDVRIDHCNFANNNNNGNSMIFCEESNVLINSNIIKNNGIETGITCFSSNPIIKFNLISDCLFYGIYCLNSSPTITNNTISNNKTGIACGNVSNPIITYNIITNNINGEGGIHIDSSSAFIYENTISYNIAQGGAGIFINNYANPLILNNFITNNLATKTWCGAMAGGGGIKILESSPTIVGNVICNNQSNMAGGGIYSDGFLILSEPKIINNTISNNLAYDSATYIFGKGGGIFIGPKSNSLLFNNILWGNSSNYLGKHVFVCATATISYCDIQDSIEGDGPLTGTFTNNIYKDPLFVKPSDGIGYKFDGLSAKWFLKSTSPCIDAGTPDVSGIYVYPTDIAGSMRILNRIIDIGAYEYFTNESVSNINNSSNDILIYPNPATDNIIVQSKDCKEQSLISTLQIYDNIGNLVMERSLNNSTNNIDISTLPKGIYFIKITSNKGTITKKLIRE